MSTHESLRRYVRECVRLLEASAGDNLVKDIKDGKFPNAASIGTDIISIYGKSVVDIDDLEKKKSLIKTTAEKWRGKDDEEIEGMDNFEKEWKASIDAVKKQTKYAEVKAAREKHGKAIDSVRKVVKPEEVADDVLVKVLEALEGLKTISLK